MELCSLHPFDEPAAHEFVQRVSGNVVITTSAGSANINAARGAIDSIAAGRDHGRYEAHLCLRARDCRFATYVLPSRSQFDDLGGESRPGHRNVDAAAVSSLYRRWTRTVICANVADPARREPGHDGRRLHPGAVDWRARAVARGSPRAECPAFDRSRMGRGGRPRVDAGDGGVRAVQPVGRVRGARRRVAGRSCAGDPGRPCHCGRQTAARQGAARTAGVAAKPPKKPSRWARLRRRGGDPNGQILPESER